jgi:hypothetical protein
MAVLAEQQMAKSIKLVNPTEFVPPRDADGRFLPREFWSKRQVAAHRKAMRARADAETKAKRKPRKNPFIKVGKGKKEMWVPPRGPDGRWLPPEKWSKAEHRRFRKAVREGLVQAPLAKPKKKPTKKKPKPKPRVEAADPAKIAREVGKEVGKEIAKAMGEREISPAEREILAVTPEWEMVEGCPPGCEGVIFPGLKERIADPLGELRAEVKDISQRAREIEKAVGKAANPIEGLALINRRRTLGDRFVGAVDFLKDNPLLAIAGIGAVVIAAVLIYKAIKLRMSTIVRAVDIANGTMSFPGQPPYQITEQDMTWLARCLIGEVGENPAAWANPQTQRGGAAVLWALANHYMTVGRKRDIYPTLMAFTRGYSQPLSARWSSPSAEGCQRQPGMCTPERLARRQRIQGRSWTSMPAQVRSLVESFVAGRLANPIGTRTDWLAASARWRQPPRDPMNVAGNVFATNPQARRREDVAVA